MSNSRIAAFANNSKLSFFKIYLGNVLNNLPFYNFKKLIKSP